MMFPTLTSTYLMDSMPSLLPTTLSGYFIEFVCYDEVSFVPVDDVRL